jgi:hypothetical protein
LGADGIGSDVARLYGFVNRALPDKQFDEFVDALAARISSFGQEAPAPESLTACCRNLS